MTSQSNAQTVTPSVGTPTRRRGEREFFNQEALAGRIENIVRNLENFQRHHEPLFNQHNDGEYPTPRYTEIIQAVRAIGNQSSTREAIEQNQIAFNLLAGFYRDFPEFREPLESSVDGKHAFESMNRANYNFLNSALRAGVENINDPKTNSVSARFEQFLREGEFQGLVTSNRPVLRPTDEQIARAREAFARFDRSLTDPSLSPAQQILARRDAWASLQTMRSNVPFQAQYSFEMSNYDGISAPIVRRFHELEARFRELNNLDETQLRAMANIVPTPSGATNALPAEPAQRSR